MGSSALVSRALLLALFPLCLWAGAARAATDNGFALYVGPVHVHDPTLGNDNGSALGVDAQFVVNDAWSLNPYLGISTDHPGNGYTSTNITGGLQARYWVGSWFIGAEYLYHDLLVSKGGLTQLSTFGPALGAAVGWEGENHWSVMLEWQGLEGQGLNWASGNTRSDVRVVVGYRWY